jgi:hypothetical protein
MMMPETVETFDMAMRTEGNWGAEVWRAPDMEEGDTLLFDECGRVLNHGDRCNVDCRSHWFRLVRARFGGCYLLVKHGGGQERINLSYAKPAMLEGIGNMTSDQRYLLLHTMLGLAHQAGDEATRATANKYRSAFVDGRLKKRKRPGQDSYKVWMET